MDLKKFIKNEMFLTLIFTFLARVIAALGSLFLLITLGRLYGPDGVGLFALVQSIYVGVGILARYGMDNTLIKYVGQEASSKNVKSYLKWSLTKPIFFSLIASIVILVLSKYLGELFNEPNFHLIVFGVSLAIPSFTMSYVLSGFMKGVNKPAKACLLENGSVSLLASLILMVIESVTNRDVANMGWAIALASWVVLLFGGIEVKNYLTKISLGAASGKVAKKAFYASSQSFFIMSFSGFIQTVASMLIAAWLLDSNDLGLLKAAERTSLLISFILLVINSVLPPRFSRLYYQNNYVGLERLARRSAYLSFLLASPMLLVCLVFPEKVLSIYGSDFVEAKNLLMIISVAAMINVSTGSVNFLLNMTGHEILMRNISLGCNAFGLVAMVILTASIGVYGSAISLSLVIILQNVIALIFAWKKLGIWLLPLPNFLKDITPTEWTNDKKEYK